MKNIGDKAPEVLGINEKGEEIRLSAYKGKKIVLYFYPKVHRGARHRHAVCVTTIPNCAKPVTK